MKRKGPTDRWLLGVIARLAWQLEWHPGWTRLAAVMLCWVAPLPMLFLYLVAAWLMPKSQGPLR
ncbi:PspC domain-containing protein [Ferrimonas gelatinilytica]|uniref:Phage shock protein PspC N-terminal domain-containing protein n=1 Tax=Ferrimonas gelatinilytica TaxID=1255257 RepID=A0ABP9S850_9GAMM